MWSEHLSRKRAWRELASDHLSHRSNGVRDKAAHTVSIVCPCRYSTTPTFLSPCYYETFQSEMSLPMWQQ